jgi:hypothetical protein
MERQRPARRQTAHRWTAARSRSPARYRRQKARCPHGCPGHRQGRLSRHLQGRCRYPDPLPVLRLQRDLLTALGTALLKVPLTALPQRPVRPQPGQAPGLTQARARRLPMHRQAEAPAQAQPLTKLLASSVPLALQPPARADGASREAARSRSPVVSRQQQRAAPQGSVGPTVQAVQRARAIERAPARERVR